MVRITEVTSDNENKDLEELSSQSINTGSNFDSDSEDLGKE